MCVCVCVCVCVHVRPRARMHVCVHVCVTSGVGKARLSDMSMCHSPHLSRETLHNF